MSPAAQPSGSAPYCYTLRETLDADEHAACLTNWQQRYDQLTAGAFAGLSLFGYTTKKDLSGWGSFLIMGVIGLILAAIVNLFLQSSALMFAVSVLGVVIFAGLTAYDTQRIKDEYYSIAGDAAAMTKTAVMGALSLYLDFINMFTSLLSLIGNRE